MYDELTGNAETTAAKSLKRAEQKARFMPTSESLMARALVEHAVKTFGRIDIGLTWRVLASVRRRYHRGSLGSRKHRQTERLFQRYPLCASLHDGTEMGQNHQLHFTAFIGLILHPEYCAANAALWDLRGSDRAVPLQHYM